VRLILDGTWCGWLDRKATSISLLVVIGVREDGQKVLLRSRTWVERPPRLGVLFSTIWRSRPTSPGLPHRGRCAGAGKGNRRDLGRRTGQRCTVHKHRNLLAHAPDRLHDEITADYTDMIYAATPEEIASRRNAFIRKWRPRHRAADSLEEAGDFHSPATDPVAQRKDHERDRASARGVQATDQNPDRATVGRYCCDVVLGAARLRADQHAESRRLADARHKPHRSTD